MVLNAFEKALNDRDEDPRRDGMHNINPQRTAEGQGWIERQSHPAVGQKLQKADERDADFFGDYGDNYDPEFDDAVRI